MNHVLPPLPYAKDALLPVLSAETLELHHDRHHAAYVSKLNSLIPGTEFESLALQDIVQKAPRGKPIFNNAAQAWNHDFLWKSLAPAPLPGTETEPGGDIGERLARDFGSFLAFRSAFESVAKEFFGSGWAWLTLDPRAGKLAIEATGNGENPLVTTRNIPLLACDLWEHAYYVDYRNERAKYLSSLWRITNWAFAEMNFREIEKRSAA